MERVPIKFELLLGVVLLFLVDSSVVPASPQITSVGPNKKQLFLTGQLCQSHHDCKSNTAYSGHFCFNGIAGSHAGHCLGFDSGLGAELKKKKKKEKKPQRGGCGKCETDADCRGCPVAAGCEKIILNGTCV